MFPFEHLNHSDSFSIINEYNTKLNKKHYKKRRSEFHFCEEGTKEIMWENANLHLRTATALFDGSHLIAYNIKTLQLDVTLTSETFKIVAYDSFDVSKDN